MFAPRHGFGAPESRDARLARCAADIAESRQVSGLTCLIPQGSEANLGPVAAAWRQATGLSTRLEIVDVTDINGRIALDALARKTTYDLALPATFGVQDLAWSRILQPLDAITIPGCDRPQADPALYELGDTMNGQRYGLQTDGDVYLMFYRDDFLRDARAAARYESRHGTPLGVAHTWRELDRQMEYFHDPSEGRFGGALFRAPSFAVWEYWSRMHANGVLPFDDALVPQIATDAAVQALEDLVRATDFQHPKARTAGLFENWDLYRGAEIFCNIGWGGSQKAFNRPGSPLRGKLRHAALPGGVIPPTSYFNWGWSYVVPRRSPNPQLAYLFAQFAVSPRISTLAIREADGYFDPFLDAHYRDETVVDVYSTPFLDAHRAAMRSALPDLYLPGYGSYFASMVRAISDVLSGVQRPRQALLRAADEWLVIQQDYDAAKLRDTWADLRRRYPSAAAPLFRAP